MTENVILILAGALIGIGIAGLIHYCRDDRDAMRKFYEHEIERLNRDILYHRDRVLLGASKEGVYIEKLKLYEKLLSKFMDERKNTTDEIFIFEGKTYMPTSFDLSREPHRADTLSVEFVDVSINN